VVQDSDEGVLVCPLGTVLRGKYRLDRVLGIGGMAVVYEATHRNQKRFAIKMLHAELSMRQDVRARFLREGYAANTVEHPGAVAVLDDDVADNGAAFLVMELLDGESVEHLWERHGRRISLSAALTIGHQLAEVLAAAHSKAIIHRDIKPANLFVTREGQLKVLDFGIARVRDAAVSAAQATGTGLVLGTPAFMAPEQALAKSEEIDARTDVWAAGATMFSLLAGRYVHDGDNAQQVLIRAATTPAPSLADVQPDVPRTAVELIDRALAFDRRQRWPSAEAMSRAIRETHVRLFGEEVSRPSLSRLLPHGDLRPSSTRCAAPLTPAVAPTLGYSRDESSRGPTPTATAPAVASGTTAQPLSRAYDSDRPDGVPPPHSLGLAIIGVVLAFAAVAIFLVWTLAAQRPSPAAASASASLTVPSDSPTIQTAPISSAVVLTPIPSETGATETATPPPSPKPIAPAPAVRRAPAPAVSASPPPRLDCNPPYTLDPETGTKHWKHECL